MGEWTQRLGDQNPGVSRAFVPDVREPVRPRVDRAVLAILKSEALYPADFTIREDGVVRLNPELARRVAGLTINSKEAG